MEDVNTHVNLFSRGASPPPSALIHGHPPVSQQAQQPLQPPQPQQSPPQVQQAQQQVHNQQVLAHHLVQSPTRSLHELPAQVSNSNPLDSLFHNMNTTTNGPPSGGALYPPQPYSSSAPATPMSTMTAGSAPSVTQSVASNPNVDRQNALLSLLSPPAGSPSVLPAQPASMGPAPAPLPSINQMQQAPTQVPTPPGSSQQILPPSVSHNEAQGKNLLEQLMAGNSGRRGSQHDSPASSLHNLAPSPPYGASPYQPLPLPTQHEPEAYFSEPAYMPPQPSRELPQPLVQPPPQPPQQTVVQPPPQTIQQPPAPPAPQPPIPQPQPPVLHQTPPQQHPSSMFDFVSPFDALASSGSTGSIRKKPAPPIPPPEEQQQQQQQQQQQLPPPQQQPWTSPPPPQPPTLLGSVSDPKRKSVENILDQLTRGQPSVAPAPAAYDAYLAGDAGAPPPAGPEPPLAGKQPPVGISSPRASPPKMGAQAPPPPRALPQPQGGNDSGLSDFASNGQSRRSKDSSPGPRGSGWRGGSKSKSKNGSQSFQPQTIVFDVAQPLEEIQAPRDLSKSTPIALVKVEPSFLPGTTIGATHWVAYGMSKGRVRVISRSSGDRTLLTLPPPFPPNVVVCDMAVHGNRLAGVTSDGGFVVWELPEVITDDVPGRLLLCVYPSADAEALLSVKWHPRQPDLLAVGSENKIHHLNILDAVHVFGGEPIPSTELHRIGPVFPMPSPLAAFDFDVNHYAIGTISVDSTLTLWGVRDMSPFWSNKIRGDDIPSSVAFINGGVVIGRRNGTVYQLLPDLSKEVTATIKFVNSNEDSDMFGHANYDARIQTLWIANNRRDSLIALKFGFEHVPETILEDKHVRPYFEQLVEFVGPKPTIHFVILTADADPTGEEAHAACVAAKVPPGDLALVAFSVHASGVDQLLIRREWFESGFQMSSSKFPLYTPPQPAPLPPPPQPQAQAQPPPQPQPQPPLESRSRQPTGASSMQPPPQPPQPQAQPKVVNAPPRLRTPPSEEVESENARDEGRTEGKGKGKSRNVGWKEKEALAQKEREKEEQAAKEKAAKSETLVPVMEAQIGNVLAKEVRKLEDNLHTRIGRLVGKELDKQHQRMEEARVAEQQADFVRQEKILKLISSELTKNTTRVVEMAVKSEVQNSVLPSLQDITKTELKAALNGQLARGLSDTVKQTLPAEIERMFMRPDVTAHLAHNFTSSITPVIEHHVNEAMSQTVIPTWKQQTAALHQEFTREVRAEMLSLKKEIGNWQSETIRSQESLIRDLEQSIRVLAEQVKFLSLAQAPAPAPPVHQAHPARDSPSLAATASSSQTNLAQYTPTSHLRQATLPMNQPTHYQASFPQQAPPPPATHQQWYPQNIAAPQASHPAIPPPVAMPPQAPAQPQHQVQRNEEWDDTYLHVLEQNDIRALHALLARSDPDTIMPLKGGSPLSQAVVLTLISRFCNAVAEMSPIDDMFGNTLWWLQRTTVILDTSDPVISSYIPRVLPGIQQTLNQTRQRLNILPGASPQLLDAVRTISDVQTMLSRKPIQL